MYAYIKGELAEINTDHIVVEAGGIGYQVFISLQTFDYLPSVGEDSGTIEDVYEPYLVKNNFINRTPKGRVATSFAYEHFGRTQNA